MYLLNKAMDILRKDDALGLVKESIHYIFNQWLSEYKPDTNIWDLNECGITSMLKRLKAKTGITGNPHTFRHMFALLLRKAGIDTMTIKELGCWESLEMVKRYTRSFTFRDSMKFYKAPLDKIY